MRRFQGLAALTLALALGHCGGDKEGPATDTVAETDTVVTTETTAETSEPGETSETIETVAPETVAEVETTQPEVCVLPAGDAPDSSATIGCKADFESLASLPLDVSIPGARSVKFIIDQADENHLYFMNSVRFPIHWNFASTHLSGNGLPIVPGLSQFNDTEYYSPQRRFILGSITYYAGPDVWALEFAPYDTASAAMMKQAYDLITPAVYFAAQLKLHPTSEAIATEAAKLAGQVPIKTTDEIFDGIDFQPLNLATSIGRVRFMREADLATECLSFRDIVVLDHVPNDLPVTLGIVTEEFQTPLSHINVLARNRHIPNMWVRDAFTNPTLRQYENQWAKLTVGLSGFTIEPATQAEADAWWTEHRPSKLTIPAMDLTKTGLWNVAEIVDRQKPLREELSHDILAFGGKATHYAAMAGADLVPMVSPKGFAIPVYYYDQFMTENGFYAKIDALLVDSAFTGGTCTVRAARLAALRDEMEAAPVNAEFSRILTEKLTAEYGPVPLRYRSSSTAEDVGGFTGAGLYTSKTGTLGSVDKGPLRAIKKIWASVWYQRGFEEREYRQVDQKSVGMAILAHPSFVDETASGVAQTANSYDPSGMQPAFVINVQLGDGSVTLPEPGQTTDQIIFYYDYPGQPIVYVSHSNLVGAGETVLTRSQLHALGVELAKIKEFFRPAYGPPAEDPSAWYALEVDFKFDVREPDTEPHLYIKQARPLPSPFGN